MNQKCKITAKVAQSHLGKPKAWRLDWNYRADGARHRGYEVFKQRNNAVAFADKNGFPHATITPLYGDAL